MDQLCGEVERLEIASERVLMDDNITGEEYGPDEIEADSSVGLEVFDRGNYVPIIRLDQTKKTNQWDNMILSKSNRPPMESHSRKTLRRHP